MQTNKQPVFYSNSGMRWKTFKGILALAGIVLVFAFTVIVLAVFQQSAPVLPKLDQNEIYKRVLNPQHLFTKKTNQNKEYAGGRTRLSDSADINYNKIYKSAPVKSRPVTQQIRAGFYVNWDAQSYISLRNNISKLNMVLPEWFIFAQSGDTIAPEIDFKALQLMRDKKISVLPMLTNYYNGAWNGEIVHRIINSPVKRKRLITQILSLLREHNFTGINIDFESLNEDSDEPVWRFQKELYNELHKHNFLVTQDIPPDNTDYNPVFLSEYNDLLFLMAYDQHNSTSAPGPISPFSWVQNAVTQSGKRIDRSKIVLGIPTYGYDWNNSGGEAADITCQEAVVTAKESEGIVVYDKGCYNLTFSYDDDDNNSHTVWFADAATCFNAMRLAADENLAGVALWRLGGEDKRIWDFFNLNLSLPELQKAPFDFSILENIYPSHDVDFQGEGEIIELVAKPDSGVVDIEYNTGNFLITGQDYRRLPSQYVMRKYGKQNKVIVLSFDDGPDEKYTPQILDILKKYNIKGSFFIIGLNAEKNLNVLKRIYDEGHEIGNHSFSHPNLAEINQDAAELELNVTRKVIEATTGHTTGLFRPPYNADAEPQSSDEIIPIELGARQNYITIGETIDPNDWQAGVSADSIFGRILEQEEYGNIILLHDAGGNRTATVEALPRIIEHFLKKGYTFSSVAGLLGKKRDDLMPPLTNKDDITFARINWVISEVFYYGMHLLFSLFSLALILSLAKIVITAILAWVQKKRAKNSETMNGSFPFVSVIVPAYNEEVTAVRTIEELLITDYPEYEIVFVNDGSSDGTLATVTSRFQDNPKVRILTKENGGKATALNYGIAAARGELLLCIDADTRIMPDAIRKMVPYFNSSKTGALSGNVKVGNEISMLTRWQSIEYITSQNFDRRALHLLNGITVVPGAIGMFRKEAILSAGSFTADTLAEDCDITIRILEAGYSIEYTPDAVAYTEAPESLSMFIRQRFRWSYGILQTIWKHKNLLFNPAVPGLGFISLPNLIIFQYIIPLLGPFVDITLAASIISGQFTHILTYYLIFTATDIVASFVAFRFEKEYPLKLWNLLLQRLVYRYLVFYIVARSLLSALKGSLVGWGQQKRSGNVFPVSD